MSKKKRLDTSKCGVKLRRNYEYGTLTETREAIAKAARRLDPVPFVVYKNARKSKQVK